MSEKPQSTQPSVKFSVYKFPKYIWFRSHLLVPLFILSGLITIYLSVMINRLALIGFVVIMAIFLVRPGSEIYHMHHFSWRERVLLFVRELGLLILIFGGILLIFLVTVITESIFPGFLILFLLLLLMNRLEAHRIAKRASFLNKSHSDRNLV